MSCPAVGQDIYNIDALVVGTGASGEQGIKEPPGAAKTYLRHETITHFDARRVDAFLENSPKAVDFFISQTCVRFDMPPVFPDYYAEAPGGQPDGRSMVTRPFDGRELGPSDQAARAATTGADGVWNGAGLRQRDLAQAMALQTSRSGSPIARGRGRHFVIPYWPVTANQYPLQQM